MRTLATNVFDTFRHSLHKTKQEAPIMVYQPTFVQDILRGAMKPFEKFCMIPRWERPRCDEGQAAQDLGPSVDVHAVERLSGIETTFLASSSIIRDLPVPEDCTIATKRANENEGRAIFRSRVLCKASAALPR